MRHFLVTATELATLAGEIETGLASIRRRSDGRRAEASKLGQGAAAAGEATSCPRRPPHRAAAAASAGGAATRRLMNMVGEPFLNVNCDHLRSFDTNLYRQLICYPQVSTEQFLFELIQE
ncbi:unnamed protein product [Caretta caretta]